MKKEFEVLLNLLAQRAKQILCHPVNEKTVVLNEDENILLAKFQSSSIFTCIYLAQNVLKMTALDAGLCKLEKHQALN